MDIREKKVKHVGVRVEVEKNFLAMNTAALMERQIFTETSTAALCICIKLLHWSCLLHYRKKF